MSIAPVTRVFACWKALSGLFLFFLCALCAGIALAADTPQGAITTTTSAAVATTATTATRLASAPLRELLPGHVTDADFKGIEPADWVLEGVVKAFLAPVDAPDIEARIDEAAARGATIVHTGGFWPYWPLVRDDPRSGLPEKDRANIKKAVARARSHGQRIIFGVAPFAPAAMVKAHLDWLTSTADDDSVRRKAEAADLALTENQGLRTLALDSPWGDMAIECLAEVMQEYGIDGYSFDGHYHPALNYSPYEKALYKKETGRELPAKIDLGDVSYRLYLIWADDKLEGWYRRLHERLRAVNPQAAIYTWTTNAGRYGHFLTSPRVMSTRMNQLFDSPVQEWWLDEVNLGASVVPAFGAAYVRAVAGGRNGACEPYIISRGNPYSADSFPAHELVTRSLMAMTNGAFTPLSGAAGTTATAAALEAIRQRAPFVTHARQVPWAAVLVSEQTRQFYAYQDIMARWLAHALGVFRVAAEEHLPLTLINDWDLTPERLAPYRVLILPNAACLSDAQVAAVRGFVAKGGGLVASCETSLFDELGRPRPGFALGDLFGVEFQGRPAAPDARPALDANFAIVIDEKYWAQRVGAGWLRWQGAGDSPAPEMVSDPRLRELVPNAQASYKGPLVKVSEPKPPMKRALFFFPEGSSGPIPAAVMGEPGGVAAGAATGATAGRTQRGAGTQGGRVVYLAAGLDAANYSYGYPYERMLLAQAIRWAAREPFPVTVTAPMCVQATFWEQAVPPTAQPGNTPPGSVPAPAQPRSGAGKRLIVHLFNSINTTAGHGLPEVEVPLREESVPVGGMKIRFGGKYAEQIKRLHLEPGGQPLASRREADGARVVEIPPLAIHAMVVGDME